MDNKIDITVKSIDFADIVQTVLYIVRGVELNQPRLLQRALRQNFGVRKFITAQQLEKLVKKYVPIDCPTYGVMVNLLEKIPVADTVDSNTMEVEEMPKSSIKSPVARDCSSPGTPSAAATTVADLLPVSVILPEVEVYIYTLIVTTLLRHDMNAEAAYAATALVERIRTFNRRSLDLLSSKAYFYFSLAYEKVNRAESIRSTLLALYRTACVRRDDIGQAVLLNLLLRNYISADLMEQAHTLSLRASLPESASNNQFCRYLYYMGRIQATQLNYSEAYQRLMVAARKAPQGYALGFTRMVYKLVVIVQLLMGDVPERSLFNQPELRQALAPYLALTQAVRAGDLIQFAGASKKYEAAYRADKNLSLVQRLGHNVLKTGLRNISLSYSRISLADIASKLHLPSANAAEYICAKAIRDGVIEAKLDHDNSWLCSQEIENLYGTEEPQKAFHKRIAFCLDVHNEAVKSMRYPPEAVYKAELARQSGIAKGGKGDGKDKDDEKTIEELIREMEDEDGMDE